MAALTRQDAPSLGNLSIRQFLRDYWQNQPVLIRAAFPDFAPAIDRPGLAALAARDDVETRLIQAARGRWRVATGPFPDLPAARRNWTILVQGVNLHVPAIDALLARFAFLPYTRLDDIMVSYAVAGGSVGAHFDSYDVFLLQAEGRRRWRISAQSDLELLEDVPLKILKNFRPTEEWILEPGDMLYLPAHIAHEGVALEPGMTYSIGFRAPPYTELAREFLYATAERVHLEGRYVDDTRAPVKEPALIDTVLLATIAEQFARIRWTTADVLDFVGRYFSEPKAHVYFTPPRAPSMSRFLALAARHGLALDGKTRLLYQGETLFINGESLVAAKPHRAWLKAFANARRASANACAEGLRDRELSTILYEWFCSGWIIKGA